ncbi:MAG: hypothetical protein Q8P41_28690 [Pseudomonadota bacterium]|nr:hypothetical protein [Pseudomonadota bacterium]
MQPDDVPAGPAFDAWRIGSCEGAAALDRPTRDQLAWIAGYALLAPTTHNTVPQRFELREDDGALALWVAREAILPESDPVGRQATVSLGCVVENAAIAGAVLGFSAEIEPLSGTNAVRPRHDGEPDLVPVVAVRFRAGGERLAPGWLDAMRHRKMVRAEYDERVHVPPALLEELVATVGALYRGLTLHVLTDAPTRLFLGKFQELADTTVINRERFARELGDWLLPNDSDAGVGMRGREFGLSDRSTLRMHLGLRGEEELLPDETAGFAKAGNVGMRTASAVLVLTAAEDDFAHRLAAGRAYERVALRLVEAGFCAAMHAGITEVEAPNMALRGRLRTRQRPTVVFRVGRPLHAEDGQRPHASRPPLDTLLVGRD